MLKWFPCTTLAGGHWAPHRVRVDKCGGGRRATHTRTPTQTKRLTVHRRVVFFYTRECTRVRAPLSLAHPVSERHDPPVWIITAIDTSPSPCFPLLRGRLQRQSMDLPPAILGASKVSYPSADSAVCERFRPQPRSAVIYSLPATGGCRLLIGSFLF